MALLPRQKVKIKISELKKREMRGEVGREKNIGKHECKSLCPAFCPLRMSPDRICNTFLLFKFGDSRIEVVLIEWGWEIEDITTVENNPLSFTTVLPSLRRNCKVKLVVRLTYGWELETIHLVPYGLEWCGWWLNASMTLQFWWRGLSKRGNCKGFHSHNEGTSHKEDSVWTISDAPNDHLPFVWGIRISSLHRGLVRRVTLGTESITVRRKLKWISPTSIFLFLPTSPEMIEFKTLRKHRIGFPLPGSD